MRRARGRRAGSAHHSTPQLGDKGLVRELKGLAGGKITRQHRAAAASVLGSESVPPCRLLHAAGMALSSAIGNPALLLKVLRWLANNLSEQPGMALHPVQVLEVLARVVAGLIAKTGHATYRVEDRKRVRERALFAYAAVCRLVLRAFSETWAEEDFIHMALTAAQKKDSGVVMPKPVLDAARRRVALLEAKEEDLQALLSSIGNCLVIWLNSRSTPADLEEGIFRRMIPALFFEPTWVSERLRPDSPIHRVAGMIGHALSCNYGQRGRQVCLRRMQLLALEHALQDLSPWLTPAERQALFSDISRGLSHACKLMQRKQLTRSGVASLFEGFLANVSEVLLRDQEGLSDAWLETERRRWRRLADRATEADIPEIREVCLRVLAQLGAPPSASGNGIPTVARPTAVEVGDGRITLDERAVQDALKLLSEIDTFEANKHTVVGDYLRYDESTVTRLRGDVERITRSCLEESREPHNYLLWAPSGHGKTFLIDEIARGLLRQVKYFPLDLKKPGLNASSFGIELRKCRAYGGASLCRIDEVDQHLGKKWPYRVLYDFLDINRKKKPGQPNTVFALIGSTGSNIEALRNAIKQSHKGDDLLTRVQNFLEIPPLSMGDRLVIALGRLKRSPEKGAPQKIRSVEKQALLYLLVNPDLATARQLDDFLRKTTRTLTPLTSEVTCAHLFVATDRQKELAFRTSTDQMIAQLGQRLVTLPD